jgi:hypothetical protein
LDLTPNTIAKAQKNSVARLKRGSTVTEADLAKTVKNL